MEVDQTTASTVDALPASVAAIHASVAATVSLSPEPDLAEGGSDDDDAMTSQASSEPDGFSLEDLVQIEGDERVALNGRQGIITQYDNHGGAKLGLPDDWMFRIQLNAHPPGHNGHTAVFRAPVSGK